MAKTDLKARKIKLLVVEQDTLPLDDPRMCIKCKEQFSAKPEPYSYRDSIALAMYAPKDGKSMGWAEYKRRSSLIDKIENCKEPGFLIVDDVEWNEIKAVWSAGVRGGFNKMVYAVGMAIEDAEEIELKEVEDKKSSKKKA